MSQANIHPKMLVWARERSGFDPSAFSQKLKIAEQRLIEWESGQKSYQKPLSKTLFFRSFN